MIFVAMDMKLLADCRRSFATSFYFTRRILMSEPQRNQRLSDLEISEIRSRQCLEKFACGNKHIDQWAIQKAHILHLQDRAQVFCAKLRGNDAAIGFYSLSIISMSPSILPSQDRDKYRGGSAPFVYIDWLGVMPSAQSNGIGKILLMNAMQRARTVNAHVLFYRLALRSLNPATKKILCKSWFLGQRRC